jgi:hypothetical protein
MFGYRQAIKLEITEILLYPATCLNNVQKYGDFKDLLLIFFGQMAKNRHRRKIKEKTTNCSIPLLAFFCMSDIMLCFKRLIF